MDAEESMRFYALRMKEIGITAAKIIAEGTDWSFLNETQARAVALQLIMRRASQ